RNTSGPRQAKEECLDDQSLTGSAAGQRLRQPVLPKKAEDGQGVQTESDAGNTFRRHLACGFHRRPGRRLLADQGHHVRWCLGRRAVSLQ
ncbi:hypothetical protein XENOCAPTIV_017836, partial [Xenoophorus captivus]